MPKGMRLVRHFADSAYFAGELDVRRAVEHVTQHVRARDMQLVGRGATFPRAYIAGDASKRLFRIDVSETARGSQIHIQDVTPPPAPTGLSEAERWRQAGRNPDGSLIDPNQLY